MEFVVDSIFRTTQKISQFLYSAFDIKLFCIFVCWLFIFYFIIVDSRKIGVSKFECSNILQFEISNFIKIFKIERFQKFDHFINLSIIEIYRIFSICKIKIRLQKLEFFLIVRLFDIPHYSHSYQCSYSPFDINQSRRFNFSIFISYLSDS